MGTRRGYAALLLAIGLAVGTAAPADAQQQLTGQLFVAWSAGPEGPHIPYVVNDGGQRTYVLLSPDAIQAAGGLGMLDRMHVSLTGDRLDRTFADGSGAFAAQSLDFLQVAKSEAGLMQKARDEGTVRVIVWLRTSFQPEGTLAGAAEIASQQAGIQAARASVLAALPVGEFETIHTFDVVPLMAMRVTPAGLAALEASASVQRIDADTLAAPALADSVPLITTTLAWSAGFTGSGIAVAVLDTGVMKTHAFFGSRVVTEACYSSTGSTGNGTYESLCPGGVTSSTAVGSGVNCTGISACDHGTHVAGIAAGAAYSGTGAVTFSGVGRNAKIAAVQVFTRFNSSVDCGGSAPCVLSWTSDQIAGLNRIYALRNTYKFASINMSIGGGLTSTNCDADSRKPIIDSLRSVGIATVIAAGNDGSTSQISYPACISTAVSVGSTTKSDVVSSFSNAAGIMHLWAPGSSINSSITTSTTSFGFKSGTSMATPHVAGAWTILKEKRPYAVGDEVRNAFISTGLSISDARSGGTVTKPRIRVSSALAAINHSTPVVQLWPQASTSTTILLWARVQNTGSAPFPASNAVWFWVDGYGYVGSTSLGGLAAGAQAWYSYNWTIPANLAGKVAYWARAWDGAPGFWTGPWAGPETIDVGYPAPITSLWPVYDTGGSLTINRGDTVRLWAYVRNNRAAALPTGAVYHSINMTGPFGNTWVGANGLSGQGPGTQVWYLTNWTIPVGQPTGLYDFNAQTWANIGGWKPWSTYFGPTQFIINP